VPLYELKLHCSNKILIHQGKNACYLVKRGSDNDLWTQSILASKISVSEYPFWIGI
jgi:hypothetical protein